jgi:hypothetical protein
MFAGLTDIENPLFLMAKFLPVTLFPLLRHDFVTALDSFFSIICLSFVLIFKPIGLGNEASMHTKKIDDISFDDLIKNAIDITHRFDIDLGGLPDDILRASQLTEPYLSLLRKEMEKVYLDPEGDYLAPRQALLSLENWFERHGEKVKEAYKNGEVLAVDGTPLISHKRYLSGQVYACAVGGLTSKDPMNLEAKLVKVMANLEDEHEENISLEDIGRIVSESDQLTRTSSWPNAFRTYQERDFAFKSKHKFVIIDGPIITQDLLTRHAGRQLYRRMLTTDNRCFVGVIKNIHDSPSDLRYYARALRTGELYIWKTLRSVLKRDLGDSEYQGDVKEFADSFGVQIIRGVYKPGLKAFGFECLRKDIPDVIALLWIDRNEQPGHEIPFLLEQVDSQLRGRYRPAETSKAIEVSLAGYSDDQLFDEIDERDLR